MKFHRWLIQNGYTPCWSTGYAGRILPSDDRIGILSLRDARPWYQYLFKRRAFLGTLHFAGPEWTFEVEGRKYMEAAVRIAQTLEAEFAVSICVKCIQEEAAMETGTFLDSLAYPL